MLDRDIIECNPKFKLGTISIERILCDLFFDKRDLEYASLADNATPYTCLHDIILILGKLEKGIQSIFDWFSENVLKANADKYHLIASSKIAVDIQICNIIVTSESRVTFLGLSIDNRFSFDYHDYHY